MSQWFETVVGIESLKILNSDFGYPDACWLQPCLLLYVNLVLSVE
jgi:hypothetical protein